MAEAEFISELLLATHEGIREGSKATIDNSYKNYDDEFPNRKTHEKRFRETVDTIGGILGSDLPQLKFRATRLLYPLFCAVFHMKFGLPRLNVARLSLRVPDYPKLKIVLEGVDQLLEGIEAAKKTNEEITLSADDRKFYDAYSEHWVHAEERTILTQHICRQFARALKD